MPSFSTELVAGNKRPYDSWTFIVVPDQLLSTFGSKRPRVRCTLNGESFSGTVSKGEGVYRMPVPRELRTRAGVSCGDTVRVFMVRDEGAQRVDIPRELQEIFAADSELAKLFGALPPAHRRAWARYIADAKRPETRIRRTSKARDGILNKRFP